MGCFMGCFGLTSNKKRRNSTRKLLPGDQRICSYEPLHSSDPFDFTTIVENTVEISSSNLRCEVEVEKEKKTTKRVRFNLDVQIYEPILQTTFHNGCSDDGEGERSKGTSVFDKEPEDLSIRSLYPSDYRYHNCVNEDEDEIGYGDSDLEDEEYSYEDNADDEEDEEDTGDQSLTPLLNPVVNLAQWNMVKARPLRVQKLMKENVEAIEKPQLKEIVINTSLSNWLASPKRSPIVDITNTNKRLSQ